MDDLFDCSEYRAEMARFTAEAVDAAMSESDPLYRSLRRVKFPEGVTGAIVEVDSTRTESPIVSMREQLEVAREDVLEGNLEQLHGAIRTIAESYLGQFMPAFFEHIGDAAEAVGNSVDLTDEELTWGRVIDLVEMTEWGEDEEGWVQPPRMVTGQTSLQERLGPWSDEEQRRWIELYLSKQEAHVSRRRSRRLR